MGIAKDAIKIGAKVLWMQEGTVHQEAADLAISAGLRVVMDRCPKKELAK
jgi:predicted CoA-binding protein